MMIATLKNWTTADRKAGNAFIQIHDAYSNHATVTLTVAVGQTARQALESNGWKITSGTRKNAQGETQFTADKKLPGLASAQSAVGSLIRNLV